MSDILIYDADCGFCTSSARWYASVAGDSARIAPWQSLDLAALGLTEATASTAVQWHANGRNWSGADACAQAMKAVPGPWRFAGVLLGMPGVIHLARLVYPVIAKNRHRLPGATDACKLPQS